MQVKGRNYQVQHDKGTACVSFDGVLQLPGVQAYQPIVQLLENAKEEGIGVIIIDIRRLRFLNSSGINMLYKFLLSLREARDTRLVIRGSKSIAWHKKAVRNVHQFVKDVEVELT